LVGLAIVLGCPAAQGQPLTSPDIISNIEGTWGWPGIAPDGVDRSCGGKTLSIWIEDEGRTYRSQTKGEKVLHSKIGMPAGETADHILIQYTNLPQPGLFGVQVVWALRMPDRDHFFWQEFPFGTKYPALERCGSVKVG
jgi:hypothetical protein